MRKFPRPVTTFAALAATAAIGLAACGGDDDEAGGGGSGSAGGGGEARTIAVNMYSREIPYFQDILKGMQDHAESLGWKIDATFADNDPTKQATQVQNALTKQPDAVVVIPIDTSSVIPAIQQAEQQGIPVLDVANRLDEGAPILGWVGTDSESVGRQKAELIVEELGGEGKVGWIHGIRGLSFSEDQVRGGMAVFDEAPGIEVVDGPYAGSFSSDDGLSATENLLSRASDLDAVFFDNDDLALGGIQAIQQKGLDNDEIFTVGTDGGAAAIDAVRKGQLDATISLCGFALGKTSMTIVEKYLEEKAEPPAETEVETLVLTTADVEEGQKKIDSGEC